MTQPVDVRESSALPLSEAARGLLRWVSCNNPFYVLSAGLFLVGLWYTFELQTTEIQAWALMGSLAGYTLLLAVTAFLLVRLARDWEDLRTVLLLVVLMFLATSVTFDEVLIINPRQGFACYLLGLAFSVAISEAVLRGIRLVLPAWYRLPYYLILALFFIYPLVLQPLAQQPHDETLLWGLFGFSSIAGLVFLTLLPAIRLGPEYVRNNGSPWSWPVYPWVLFGLLGLAVPGRAFLLCYSMHLLPVVDRGNVIFGFYFLIPFALAIAVLLLEIGVVSGRRGVLWIALAAPLGLVALSLIGHREDRIYREFFELFASRLGATPFLLTVFATAAFFGYAALRRVSMAAEALTAILLVLAVIAGDAKEPILVAPILAAVAVQFVIGLWRRSAWRCLFAVEGIVAVVAIALPHELSVTHIAEAIIFHLALLGVLSVGAVFNDNAGRFMRALGAALILTACVFAMFGRLEAVEYAPEWAVACYPLAMAMLLAAYAKLLRDRFSLRAATLIGGVWLTRTTWLGYFVVRQFVAGMDQLALSMALFAAALIVSLRKAGVLQRWVVRWKDSSLALDREEENEKEIESPG